MLTIFFALVGLVAFTRLFELDISRRHRRALLERGARAIPDPGFATMVLLHTAILGGSIVEVVFLRPLPPAWLSALSILGVVLANALRIWAIRSLGMHWNVRVVDSTALGIVRSGPYRFVRHPNYMAVFLELLLLPLVQGAWLTAAAGALLHVAVLGRRLRLEESILLGDPRYRASFAETPRFVPRLFGRASVVPRTEEP